MTVFALMDEWLACTGSSDDAWLSLGLDVLDGWQAGRQDPGDPLGGQQHLAATVIALRAYRPLTSPPDPVSLAVWFHHCGGLDPALLDRLAQLGGPALGIRVGRLVRGLLTGDTPSADPAAALLHAVHRSALSPSHLTPVRAAPPDQ